MNSVHHPPRCSAVHLNAIEIPQQPHEYSAAAAASAGPQYKTRKKTLLFNCILGRSYWPTMAWRAEKNLAGRFFSPDRLHLTMTSEECARVCSRAAGRGDKEVVVVVRQIQAVQFHCYLFIHS